MALIWEMHDDAERALRRRPTFRAHLCAVANDADVAAAELIYGELLANVVRHARGRVEVRLELDDAAPVLVVRDFGPGMRSVPYDPRREPMAESGRGLAIVERLAEDLEVERIPDGGTMIRAKLPTGAGV